MPVSPEQSLKTRQVWWGNAIFFLSVHLIAAIGISTFPPTRVPTQTVLLSFFTWQFATFGITVGYHRLWSHRSFEASLAVRCVLAILGTAGCQGSIKWWSVLISPGIMDVDLIQLLLNAGVFDTVCIIVTQMTLKMIPSFRYAATRGMIYAHMGWIFFKPRYSKMRLVDQTDLERDVVVRLQHRFYVPFTIAVGFLLPFLLGMTWGDPYGALIWGGFVARILIWHCIFLVNSLAHWDGLQPYTDEDTSRTNLIVALLVAGEGNHNYVLHYLGVAVRLRRAPDHHVQRAKHRMDINQRNTDRKFALDAVTPNDLRVWDRDAVFRHVEQHPKQVLLLIDGYLVNVTSYLEDHPGGRSVLLANSLFPRAEDAVPSSPPENLIFRDASNSFRQGLNRHSQAAHWMMEGMRVAKYVR
ncbi:hypothetical protein HGRIS_005703 [Hohenbuehelia grisea]|uniref:Cytochrome b5 heme-binding domain-containing protein n=1 Tax=Hohenbuehelia grisea TaxID=104357 RepID=A0ABR3JYN7_9AGAR